MVVIQWYRTLDPYTRLDWLYPIRHSILYNNLFTFILYVFICLSSLLWPFPLHNHSLLLFPPWCLPAFSLYLFVWWLHFILLPSCAFLALCMPHHDIVSNVFGTIFYLKQKLTSLYTYCEMHLKGIKTNLSHFLLLVQFIAIQRYPFGLVKLCTCILERVC